jgi:hypothetical protein
MHTSIMATRKQDAKTEQQLLDERFSQMLTLNRQLIEAAIITYGQMGFNVRLPCKGLAEPSKPMDHATLVRGALDTVIKEYRDVGWRVDYDYSCSDENGWVDVKFS